MGRLTRDPEIRYSQGATPICVAKYGLAVPRKFKRDNEPDCDFINCVAFGKSGEFVEKYLRKGQQIAISGRMQTGNYDHKDGYKVYTTDIVVEDHYFTGKKEDGAGQPSQAMGDGITAPAGNDIFLTKDESLDDEDLPF